MFGTQKALQHRLHVRTRPGWFNFEAIRIDEHIVKVVLHVRHVCTLTFLSKRARPLGSTESSQCNAFEPACGGIAHMTNGFSSAVETAAVFGRSARLHHKSVCVGLHVRLRHLLLNRTRAAHPQLPLGYRGVERGHLQSVSMPRSTSGKRKRVTRDFDLLGDLVSPRCFPATKRCAAEFLRCSGAVGSRQGLHAWTFAVPCMVHLTCVCGGGVHPCRSDRCARSEPVTAARASATEYLSAGSVVHVTPAPVGEFVAPRLSAPVMECVSPATACKFTPYLRL